MCRSEPSAEERMPAATGKGALAAWLRWVGACLRPVAAHEGISAGLNGAGFFAVPPWRVRSDHSLWVLAKGRPWCNKYIPVVGTVCSMNTHIFPYVKRFILTTMGEVRHVLEPGKWSTAKRREVTCSVVCLSKTKMSWNRSPRFPNYILKHYDGWITMLDLARWWLGSSYGQLLTIRAKQEGPFP